MSIFRYISVIFDRIHLMWSTFHHPPPSRACPNPWRTPEIGLPDRVSGLAYLRVMQIRGDWTQKKGPEAPETRLRRARRPLEALGELELIFPEWPMVPEWLRIEHPEIKALI